MKTATAFLALTIVCAPMLAQTPTRRIFAGQQFPAQAESAIKQAAVQLGDQKRIFERDLEVMNHLRIADDALADNMQPSAAVQKAFDHVDKAKSLSPEITVLQGVIRVHKEIDAARRSPASADFGRLRSLLRDEALRPASRVVVRNALRLEEETLAWIKVQELVSAHLRTLSEIAGESLRASER